MILARRTAVAVLLVLAAAPARAQAPDEDLDACFPADIPGGPASAAKAIRSGIPQLVRSTLEDVIFAQEEPRFLPWRIAMEGRASAEAREAWCEYLSRLLQHDEPATQLRKDATAWLESREDFGPDESARLGALLLTESALLAARHEAGARTGNMNALMSLSGNPAGHQVILEVSRDPIETRRILAVAAASYTRAILFRKRFEEWMKSTDLQISFHARNGLLRLGDPKDLVHLNEYLRSHSAIRRFETYRAASWIDDPKTMDAFLEEIERATEVNRPALVLSMSRLSDPRVLPTLRKLRDEAGWTDGVVRALWRKGRAADVPWLLERLKKGSVEASWTLRRLLGRALPIAPESRVESVQAWLDAHASEIEADAELPLK